MTRITITNVEWYRKGRETASVSGFSSSTMRWGLRYFYEHEYCSPSSFSRSASLSSAKETDFFSASGLIKYICNFDCSTFHTRPFRCNGTQEKLPASTERRIELNRRIRGKVEDEGNWDGNECALWREGFTCTEHWYEWNSSWLRFEE